MRQAERSECGLACIGMVASYWKYDVDLATLRREHPMSARGAVLSDLVRIAGDIGLRSRAIRCEPKDLLTIQLPAILHWNFDHFVVLVSATSRRVEILDPAQGRRVLKLEQLGVHFTGIALELRPTIAFKPREERIALPISQLVRFDQATWAALGQGLVLSILLQVFVVVGPLILQLVIDQAIAGYDLALLLAVCFALLLVRAFEQVTSVMRSLVFQFVSSILTLDMRANVFRHLIRLPLNYFYRRHVGDIQQRFLALLPISDFVVNGAIAALLDGVLAIFIGIAVFAYDARMGIVVVVGLGFYVALRVVFLGFSMRASEAQIDAQARQSSNFLETLRAAQTLKAMGGEATREAAWQNLSVGVANANIGVGNLGIAYAALSQSILAVSTVVVVYMAASSVIAGAMTVGAMTAFLAYKGQLEQRLSALIELYLRYRMLDVYLGRVADIVLEPVEEGIDRPRSGRQFGGRVEFQAVSFRYSPHEPDVLKSISLSIDVGEIVAITGPSGSGKSTLLRLITGLYRPSAGLVLFDGDTLSTWSATDLRSQMSVVLQDDVLLAGSIVDNITMFEDAPNLAQVQEVARIACIHDDIERMPMAYRTSVGDMGSTMSGGQQQRIMIARALYRRPKLLVMDEATAHLDIATERQVIQGIKNLGITCIMAAHRPDAIAAATRSISLRA